MEKQKQLIDDLFKDELGSYAETPPPMAWEALEKRLDGAPPRGAGVYSRKSGYYTRRGMYVALLCTVLVLSITIAKKINQTPAYNTTGGAITAVDNAATKAGTAGTGTTNKTEDNTTGNTQPVNTDNANNAPQTAAQNETAGNNNTPGINSIAATGNHKQPVNAHHRYNSGNYSPVKKPGNRTKKGEKGAGGANDEAETAASFPTQIYNSTGAPVSSVQLAANDKTDDDATNKPPAKDQKKVEKPMAKAPADAPKQGIPKTQKPHFARFEAGVKVGFERGFDNDGAQKLVASPYIQYNLSPKFAIMVQPAVKVAAMNTRRIGTPRSYYREGDSSITSYRDPYAGVGGGAELYSLWHYTYSQTRDSIVKTYTIGGSYAEYDLPVLLKYNITRSISVYGGVNIAYSKQISVKEQTYNRSIAQSDTTPIQLSTPTATQAPAPQYTVSHFFPYQGTNITDYHNPYPAAGQSTFRAGYMLGFSYTYNKRWLLDGLVQQTQAATNVQSGYNINTALSSAYFRFTLGYKITK